MRRGFLVKVVASNTCLILLAISHPAFGQSNVSIPSPGPRPGTPYGSTPSPLEMSLDSAYNLRTRATMDGLNKGDSDAADLRLALRGTVTLDERWTGLWGLGSHNLFLGSIPGVPIPEQINTLSLSTGAGYRINDRWFLNGLVRTTLYRFEDLGGSTFGFSGAAFGVYQANPELRWTFGFSIAPESDLPVLPLVGVKWLMNEQFTLDVGLPKTRLTYRTDPAWSIYTGLEMAGTTFRTGKHFGTDIGFAQYNSALASYRDIRLAVGASYTITPGLLAEMELGASVYRRIDYKDLDREVNFRPGPYVRVGLSFKL